MANNVTALYEELFETMRGVKSGEITPENAKIVGDLGQVIINAAKAETSHVKATNGVARSNFLAVDAPEVTNTKTGTKTVSGASTVHRLAG